MQDEEGFDVESGYDDDKYKMKGPLGIRCCGRKQGDFFVPPHSPVWGLIVPARGVRGPTRAVAAG